MFQFQSYERNVDLGDKVHFRNYNFATPSVEIAEFVRRNIKQNSHLYWETTPEVLREQVVPPHVEKKRAGRPPLPKVVAGARQSEEKENN